MNVVDSSGWIEFFAAGQNGKWFGHAIADLDQLVVASISVYEVYRHSLVHVGSEMASEFYNAMTRGQVVDLTADLAAFAAVLAHEHKLAMADAIILATARQAGATLWTQDADFKGIEGVEYRPKLA